MPGFQLAALCYCVKIKIIFFVVVFVIVVYISLLNILMCMDRVVAVVVVNISVAHRNAFENVLLHLCMNFGAVHNCLSLDRCT